MTIKQEIRFKMYLSVDEFLAKNENLTKALPEFPSSLTEFKDVINKIKLIDEQQENVRTGVAKDKRDIKNSLIALTAEKFRKGICTCKSFKG